METKAVGLMLLLGEVAIRDDVHFIGVREWDSVGDNEHRLGFLRDMQARRGRLDELTKKLAGLFVPQPPELETTDDSSTPGLIPPQFLPLQRDELSAIHRQNRKLR